METIDVVVADDHDGIRRQISRRVNREPDITVVGQGADGVEALRLTLNLEPDVLLLDMEMPRLTGVDVIRRLQKIDLPVRVLAVTAHDDEHYVRAVLANGTAGYLLKEDVPNHLVEAVRAVALGNGPWLSPEIEDRIS